MGASHLARGAGWLHFTVAIDLASEGDAAAIINDDKSEGGGKFARIGGMNEVRHFGNQITDDCLVGGGFSRPRPSFSDSQSE
jgi:hypothetical protein